MAPTGSGAPQLIEGQAAAIWLRNRLPECSTSTNQP